jgi:Tfp pilus assembly protein PilV
MVPHRFMRMAAGPQRSIRGVSIAELAVAVLVITISVLVVFSVFARNQVQLIGAIRDQQLSQVIRNEGERMMSLDYNDVNNNTTNPTVDGQQYQVTVTVAIVQLSPPAPQPVAKQVTVVGWNTATPAETETIIVVKAP